MTNSTIVMRAEQNGVEFYTVEATGESGMSQSGLAALVGVDQSTISKLEKTLMQ
jgi:ribosome-binding protein aMBF1 (putative translation factor)